MATILEMLDSLEAGILTLRAIGENSGVGPVFDPDTGAELNGTSSLAKAPPMSPAALRIQMEKADLTEADFATLFKLRLETVEGWLAGATRIPGWVAPSLRVIEMLSAAARVRLLAQPKPQPPPRLQAAPAKKHPFSRIEEL